jgi:hypothetical protein
MFGNGATPPISPSGETVDAIDMAEAAHVTWVKDQRDPALWHQAAMAALAYRGDEHGFVQWLLAQADMDRATAGWIFLWAEGSRYLRGITDFPLENISSEKMVEIFRSLCRRSESTGFNSDALGLDKDFEPERRACLDIAMRREVAAGIIVPNNIIARPFAAPQTDARFTLDDGLILL